MLDLSLPDWAADVAPGDILLFRFQVAAGSELSISGLTCS